MPASTEPYLDCGNDVRRIETKTVRNIDEAKTEVGDR